MVGITDSEGTLLISYSYEAYGEGYYSSYSTQSALLARINPLCYRGYVYDTGTNLYYLQSRYYDPTLNRFLNADDLVSTGQSFIGCNMFAYCGNNPVNRIDPEGTYWQIILFAVIVCVAIGIDHYVAKNHNGMVSKYNKPNENGIGEKAEYATGAGFSCDQNGMTVCDSEIGLWSLTYSETTADEELELDIVNLCTATAEISADWSGIPSADVSMIASVYSASANYTLKTPGLNVTVTGVFYAGGAGVGAEFNPEEGEFEFTPPSTGIFYTIGVDFDKTS